MSLPDQIPISPITEDVLKLSNQTTDGAESNTSKFVDGIMKSAELNEIIQNGAKQSIIEMHQERMFFLREQLKYLKETEWKYTPIDKLIGGSVTSEIP